MKAAITGHQDLGSGDAIAWIEDQLENEISKLPIDLGYSCLALGADQLFAEILSKHKIAYVAIIPSYNYETTFNSEHIDLYKALLNNAVDQIQLQYPSPTQDAFFEASKLLVKNCEILFAIWNNAPAKGFGGTADVVAYAKGLGRQIIHLNPITQTIKQY